MNIRHGAEQGCVGLKMTVPGPSAATFHKSMDNKTILKAPGGGGREREDDRIQTWKGERAGESGDGRRGRMGARADGNYLNWVIKSGFIGMRYNFIRKKFFLFHFLKCKFKGEAKGLPWWSSD